MGRRKETLPAPNASPVGAASMVVYVPQRKE